MAPLPLTPATLVAEELPRIARATAGRPALDLACGRGRNALALARAGVRVIGVDRDARALAELGARASESGCAVARVRADVEASGGLPFASDTFGAVLVFRFLFRALAPEIVRVLAPGGALLYETFSVAQRSLGGGPQRAAFLLEPGELPRLFPMLRIVRSEEGVFAEPQPTALARLVAEKLR